MAGSFLYNWMTNREFRTTVGHSLEIDRDIRAGTGQLVTYSGAITIPAKIMDGDRDEMDRFVVGAVSCLTKVMCATCGHVKDGGKALVDYMREHGYEPDGHPLHDEPA